MNKIIQFGVVCLFSALLVAIAEHEAQAIETEFVIECKNYIDEITQEYVEREIPSIRTSSYISLTFEEMDLLESIAMAEAEGEDVIGKALVMRTVLNRVQKHSESVSEVIYKPNQFALDRMGIKPSEDCHEALNMILEGWDESQGAIYFNAGHYSEYGEPLFKYGGHYFSR